MGEALSIQQACASILGDDAAHCIEAEMGTAWLVVAAMAAAKAGTDPRAIAAIREHLARENPND